MICSESVIDLSIVFIAFLNQIDDLKENRYLYKRSRSIKKQ